jgi:1-acyl-sn-glycerol-3-phosphate acyltransferase
MDKRSQLKCLSECKDLLAKGASVLFFPEGTRSKDGKMAEFKKVPGSASAGVPCGPILVWHVQQLHAFRVLSLPSMQGSGS